MRSKISACATDYVLNWDVVVHYKEAPLYGRPNDCGGGRLGPPNRGIQGAGRPARPISPTDKGETLFKRGSKTAQI